MPLVLLHNTYNSYKAIHKILRGHRYIFTLKCSRHYKQVPKKSFINISTWEVVDKYNIHLHRKGRQFVPLLTSGRSRFGAGWYSRRSISGEGGLGVTSGEGDFCSSTSTCFNLIFQAVSSSLASRWISLLNKFCKRLLLLIWQCAKL